MKKEKRNSMKVAGIGAAFVFGLLVLSYLHNPSPDITTPEQDAQMLRLKAETIRTEADLRELEKLAYEYEMAYKHSYNGAKAMYFKSLYEPILIEAGDKRERIRELEQREESIAQALIIVKQLSEQIIAKAKAEAEKIIMESTARQVELEEEIARLEDLRLRYRGELEGDITSLMNKFLQEIKDTEVSPE